MVQEAKFKKIIKIILTVLVLLLSFTLFPMFGLGLAFLEDFLASFILTCIFVGMWLAYLGMAIYWKSKMLLNVYMCYWLLVAASYLIIFILSELLVLEMIMSALMVLFLMPMLGVVVFNADDMSMFSYIFISIIIPLALFLIGYIAKNKLAREVQQHV